MIAVKLRKSIGDTILHCMLPKNKQPQQHRRCLIIVNVVGSAGPLRFVVNQKDSVIEVIQTALKLYAREKRLPLLGSSDVNDFLLYPANAGFAALSLTETIGNLGVRKFLLCKKAKHPHMMEARSEMVSQKKGNSLKAWFNKSFSFN